MGLEVPLVVTSLPRNFITQRILRQSLGSSLSLANLSTVSLCLHSSYCVKFYVYSLPEGLMGDQFEPAPAVLIVSEAVIALPLHHSGTLLVNKPGGRKMLLLLDY